MCVCVCVCVRERERERERERNVAVLCQFYNRAGQVCVHVSVF